MERYFATVSEAESEALNQNGFGYTELLEHRGIGFPIVDARFVDTATFRGTVLPPDLLERFKGLEQVLGATRPRGAMLSQNSAGGAP